MKILHLHTRYRQAGGEDRVVDSERSLLEGAGHTVLPYDAFNARGALGAATQLAASPWNLRSAIRIRDVVRGQTPDLAHIHNVWFALSPSSIRASSQGIPAIMTLHNYRLTCISGTLYRDHATCELCLGNPGWNGLRYRCYRRSSVGSLAATAANLTAFAAALNRVSRFIVMTSHARAIFVRAGLERDRLAVLPHFTRDPGPRPNPPSKSGDVLFVGRLSEEKGIHTVLEAWSREPRKYRFKVIGAGPLETELRIRFPNVAFLGHLQRHEIEREMLGARALLFPSLWLETQGMVILEAMASGLPVLASDLPTIRETMQPLGRNWFVPPGDADAWAARFAMLDESHLVDAAAKLVRDRYTSTHTPEKGLERLTSLYRDVLAR